MTSIRERTKIIAAIVLSGAALGVLMLFALVPPAEILCHVIGETEYTRNYSWFAYCKVRQGMTRAELISTLGEPFWVQRGWEIWSYNNLNREEVRFVLDLGDDVDKVTITCSRVETRRPPADLKSQTLQSCDANQEPRWRTKRDGELAGYQGATADEIRARFGEPQHVRKGLQDRELWRYSRSPSGTHYIARVVRVDPETDRVIARMSYVHWD